MEIYKCDKRGYLFNFIAGLAVNVGGVLIFSFIFPKAWHLSNAALIAIVVVILLKVGDALTQFLVKEIRIDKDASQMSFKLKSILSGQEIKSYDLREISTEFLAKPKLSILGFQDTLLKIKVGRLSNSPSSPNRVLAKPAASPCCSQFLSAGFANT